MPKLGKEKAAAVKKADTTNPFEAIPEGNYKFKLTKVESGKSKAGNAMWTWFFTQVDGKKKLREYTTLEDDALWKIAQIFEAFGVSPDVSTDTLLGKTIILHVGAEIAEQGKLKGKTVNYIVGYPDQEAAVIGPFEADATDSDDAETVEDVEPKPAPKKTAARKTAKATADESPDF